MDKAILRIFGRLTCRNRLPMRLVQQPQQKHCYTAMSVLKPSTQNKNVKPLTSSSGYFMTRTNCTEATEECHIPDYAETNSSSLTKDMLDHDMIIIEDFVSEDEEKNIIQELEPYMARLRYEYSHWDDVSSTIVGSCVQ